MTSSSPSSPLPLKVGFIGLSQTGWASMASLPALQLGMNAETYTLVALATRSSESAAAAAKKYEEMFQREVKGYYGAGIEQLVNDPNVDLVAVSVKAPDHGQAMKYVLEAGKPFLLEWPAGCGSKQTMEFARAAAEKNIKHMVGLQDRQNPLIGKMKEILDSGRIGKVLATNIISMSPRELSYWGPQIRDINEYSNEPDAHATLLDILIMHQMEPFTYLLGDWSSVSATSSTQWPVATLVPSGRTKVNKVPDHYAFTGLLESGAQASVTWRAGYPAKGRRLQTVWEIDGTEGIVRYESEHSMILAEKGRLFLNDEEVFAEGEVGFAPTMARLWEEFAKPDGNYVGLKEAVKLKTLVDAIETSVREGRRVDL